MITKVASSTTRWFFPSLTTYSKPKKVALAVLALMALGLLVKVGLSLWGGRMRPLPPPPTSSAPQPTSSPEINLEHLPDEENVSIEIAKNDYPSRLVEVLGGEEKFKAIPSFQVSDRHLVYIQEGIPPYLRIEPREMTASIMQGKDSFNRSFLAVRYRDKKTQVQNVDIFLCRDPAVNRWYLNEERSPETFSIEKGQPLWFLGLLISGVHENYELC